MILVIIVIGGLMLPSLTFEREGLQLDYIADQKGLPVTYST